jgi:SAM-dependent methyltransferase
VGKNTNQKTQEPVPFREEEDGSQAYLFLQDGEVRDLDGKIISDKTVVEFYYNDDAEVDPRFRWIPIRTRYDKTESVMKYQKNYGNYITVANKVWRSITNPVLMSDFKDLARGNQEEKNDFFYDKKIESIRAKIGKELIISANKENAYYTVTGNLAKPWRAFHNWIKSLIIYTHCHYMYQDGKHLSVLDVGCGRGGDIMKYYYANIEFLVGIDPAKDGLVNSFNGAISRYNNFRKGKPRFPRMDFFQGDGGALFNYDDQFRALGGISFDDKKLMEKYFSKDPSKRVMFDRISSQFAVHYMFASKESLTNFKQNLNDYLKPGGYFIATCFDAEKVHKLFGDSDKFSAYYTNEKGEKKLFFQIVKKYTDKKEGEIFEEGNAIDFFGAWMFQEGQYETEYLVDKRFITKEFLDDCDLELIDTDTFDSQYRMHKEFVTKYAQYEDVAETRKFFMSVKEFYDEEETDINKGCLMNDSITRFYVFRKKDKAQIKQKENKKQSRTKTKTNEMKGGKVEEEVESDNEFDLSNDKKYYLPKLEAHDNSLYRSVHEVLQTHKIVPKSESFKDLFKVLGVKVPKSNSKVLYDSKALQEFGDKIVIEHENEDGDEKDVINGLSITTIEKVKDKYIVDKPKKLNKANVVLLKEGNLYTPIYNIDKQFNKKGLFKKDDDFLKKIFKL